MFFKHLKKKKFPILMALAVLILSATVLGGISRFLSTPTETIYITPTMYHDNAILNRMEPLQSHPYSEQISDSAIFYTPTLRPPNHAMGWVTLENKTTSDITLQSFQITGTSGIPVHILGPILIPASPPGFVFAPAFADPAGASGNLPQFDIIQYCCAKRIFAKSMAFSLNPRILAEEMSGVQAEGESYNVQTDQGLVEDMHLQEGEHLEYLANGSATCQNSTTSLAKAIGGSNATVLTFLSLCTEKVYVASSDKQIPFSKGVHFQVVGNMTLFTPGEGVNIYQVHASIDNVFVYHFTPDDFLQLAQRIAGKSQTVARHILLQQPQIAQVRFSFSGNLPGNPGHIQIVFQTT